MYVAYGIIAPQAWQTCGAAVTGGTLNVKGGYVKDNNVQYGVYATGGQTNITGGCFESIQVGVKVDEGTAGVQDVIGVWAQKSHDGAALSWARYNHYAETVDSTRVTNNAGADWGKGKLPFEIVGAIPRFIISGRKTRGKKHDKADRKHKEWSTVQTAYPLARASIPGVFLSYSRLPSL